MKPSFQNVVLVALVIAGALLVAFVSQSDRGVKESEGLAQQDMMKKISDMSTTELKEIEALKALVGRLEARIAEQKTVVVGGQAPPPPPPPPSNARPTAYHSHWGYFKNDKYWSETSAHRNKIPGPPPNPSIGEAHGLDWPRTVSERCRQHIFAQGMQDGLLLCIFMAIGSSAKFFVEFGHDSLFEANSGLMYFLGWKGLFLDGATKNPLYNISTGPITAENIVGKFEAGGVPKNFDYLSADLDATEWYVTEAILKAGYRPRVISMEYNMNVPISSNYALARPKDGGRWDNSCFFSNTLGAQKVLADRFGYGLVGIDTALDAFWVDKSLLHPDTKYIDNDDPAVIEYYRGNIHPCAKGWDNYPWFDVKANIPWKKTEKV